MKVKLPQPVATIYRAVRELELRYPGRKFTPDGHLVGSIGEVVAAEALGLTLYPASYPGHDAYDKNGDVQIKLTGGGAVSLYSTCDRLVVLRIDTSRNDVAEAEIVYDGPGEPVWSSAGKMQKNGQRSITLARLRKLGVRRLTTDDIEDPDNHTANSGHTAGSALDRFLTSELEGQHGAALLVHGEGRELAPAEAPEGADLHQAKPAQ
ncbi:hypothetical protein SAMN05192571_102169 [Pleomorphomonas diazotrophica]|uniref:DUF6998 domain-containing protein n=1 Tax=Pleomorphomonas diazotrophica TaxID=1166257 RepID=UPI0008E6561D|nr:hypothetical protein SAMN05192571_102169 [Pleomorphomonas diazotrophica]